MRFSYHRETDSLYIDFAERPAADSREVAPGVVLDVDGDGKPVGIDIQRASQVADLSRLVSDSLPVTALSLDS